MMTENIYDKDTELLSLINDEMEAEFKMATQRAIDNNDPEFYFHGYSILTEAAMDVMHAMSENRYPFIVYDTPEHRTYH